MSSPTTAPAVSPNSRQAAAEKSETCSKASVALVVIVFSCLFFAVVFEQFGPSACSSSIAQPSAVAPHAKLRGPDATKAPSHKYAPLGQTPPLSIADDLDVTKLAAAWKDCSGGIYMDVGSNVGVQVRKLYKPEQFPGADVLPIFQEYFGADRRKVCAVGFEPNPNHDAYLQTVNKWFEKKGHQAVILTNVAVSSHRGTAMFHKDPDAPAYVHEWGASLGNVSGDKIGVPTTLLDLSEFYWKVIHPIILQEKTKTGKAPPLLMKVDIEGAEFAVVPHMMLSGALCQYDKVFIEWHNNFRLAMPEFVDLDSNGVVEAFKKLRKVATDCKVVMDPLDDESYVDGPQYPLD